MQRKLKVKGIQGLIAPGTALGMMLASISSQAREPELPPHGEVKTPVPKAPMSKEPGPKTPASKAPLSKGPAPLVPGPSPLKMPAASKVESQSDSKTGGQRLREGSRLLDVVGKFKVAGEHVFFYPDDSSDSFRVLENLSLERVNQILGGSRESQQWVISGSVTEYNGANYLLVTKAVQGGKNEAGR